MTIRVLLFVLCLSIVSGCNSEHPVFGDSNEQPTRAVQDFASAVIVSTNSPGSDMSVYDVDANGRPDIIIPLIGGNVTIIWNHSLPGSFCFAHQTSATDNNIVQASIHQYDPQELPSLLLLDSSGRFTIQSQSDVGMFAPPSYALDGLLTHCFAVDTVNSDDVVPDVLFASDTDGGVSALCFEDLYRPWQNSAMLSLDNMWIDRPLDATFTDFSLCDLDHNGLQDAIAADSLNNGIQVYMHYAQPNKPGSYTDPDGNVIPLPQDIIYPDYTSKYRASVTRFGGSLSPLRINTGDIDKDGIEDVVVLFKTGNQHYSDTAYYFTDISLASSANLPAYILIVYKGIVDTSSYFETDSPPFKLEFRTALYFPAAVQDFKLVDLDQDDNLDIVGCAGRKSLTALSYFFYYLADSVPFTFEEPVGYSLAGDPLRLVAADFDGDTLIDVAVLNPLTSGLAFYRNGGSDPNNPDDFTGADNPGIVFNQVQAISIP